MSTTKKSRKAAPPRRSGEQAQALLIASARELFGRQGYAGTSTRDVATHANVPERLIYRHFVTKAELFLQVVAKPLTEFVTRFSMHWSKRASAGRILRDITTKFVEELMALFVKHRGLLLDLATLIDGGGRRSAITKVDSHLFDPLFTAVIIHSKKEAERVGWDLPDLPFDVRFTFALVLSVALFENLLFVQPHYSRKKLVDELTRFVIRGSNTPPGTQEGRI